MPNKAYALEGRKEHLVQFMKTVLVVTPHSKVFHEYVLRQGKGSIESEHGRHYAIKNGVKYRWIRRVEDVIGMSGKFDWVFEAGYSQIPGIEAIVERKALMDLAASSEEP